MTKQGRPVMIELSSSIEDNGTVEKSHMQHSGEFFQKGKLDVLRYEEQGEDGFSTKNLITIQPEKVSIKRTGNVSMNQQFQQGQITENMLKHPYGSMHMETSTQTISYDAPTIKSEGCLTIEYTVKLNGQDERSHEIKLTIIEEGAK
ncbi:DUF1934 domain-containing protein [Oceanobacillus manasiensis]|uniref:DUF1934 domain-containing protein n=1 Tax=Oceanobacillus manasiensis TaxID=586413 RepID=UPI0005AB17D5|nr:DUF1934 domain-containing protein [Oceanobacillus manasiensis]